MFLKKERAERNSVMKGRDAVEREKVEERKAEKPGKKKRVMLRPDFPRKVL